MQTFLALAYFPDLQHYFSKAISLSGMLDLELSSNERPEMKEMFEESFGLNKENEKEWYYKRSIKYHIDKISKTLPLILIQGVNDNRVSLGHGRELYKLMKEKGHNIKYYEVQNAAHCLNNCLDRDFILSRIIEE